MTDSGPILRRGDPVAVVAPGFAVAPDRLAAGIRVLEKRGFDVRPGRSVRAVRGYLAGPDEDRLWDLAGALSDPDIRAVWFARGGYGTARLLDRLPWKRLRDRSPGPVLIGYSDLTALFSSWLRRFPGRCLYAPVVSELGRRGSWHDPSLRAALEGRDYEVSYRRNQVLVPGKAAGRLLGGNLTVLSHLAGTRHAPPVRGAILALEDVGEEVYRLDRMLQHLRMAGWFRGLAAVLLGRFDPPSPAREFPGDRPLGEILLETFEPLRVPVVHGLAFGHVDAKRTLPLGDIAVVDTDRRTVRFVRGPAV